MELLRDLFPALSLRGSRPDAGAKRIGSAEYFARYLYLAVAPDDVSDAEVQAALDEALSGKIGEKATLLLDKLVVAPEPTVDKLARSPIPDASGARALLPFAAQVLASSPYAGLLGRVRFVPVKWIASLLGAADQIGRASCRERV